MDNPDDIPSEDTQISPKALEPEHTSESFGYEPTQLQSPRLPEQRSGGEASTSGSSQRVLTTQRSGSSRHQPSAPATSVAATRSSLRRTNSDQLGRISPGRVQQPAISIRPASAERAMRGMPSLTASVMRQKDRFVSLPDQDPTFIAEEEPEDLFSTEDEAVEGLPGGRGTLDEPGAKHRGRITVYCVADSFNRGDVEDVLKSKMPQATYTMYPEAVYLCTDMSANPPAPGDVFIFDYGVVACWGLTEAQERSLLTSVLRSCQVKPLTKKEVQVDELSFHYSMHKPPHIQNDCITINRRQAADHQIKLAISHALAQSVKLNVYEDSIYSLVEEVRLLPESLAKHGDFRMPRRQMACLMGKVFLQKSAVNLLSSVLDTPDFFWRMPDSLQAIYDKVCEYQDLDARIELINARLQIIQKMLNIWGDHSHHARISRLDNIIILLVLIEVIMAGFQVVGLIFRKVS